MRWWDIETVVPLAQRLFADDAPWSAESFWAELAGVPDTRWYVVAEYDGCVVGYAGLTAPSMVGEPADVQTIAVEPGLQRQGIGTSLMRAMIAEARRRDAGELMLEVRADNDPARAFYARHGFQRLAIRRHYYRGRRDAIVMRRRLPRRPGDEPEGRQR